MQQTANSDSVAAFLRHLVSVVLLLNVTRNIYFIDFLQGNLYKPTDIIKKTKEEERHNIKHEYT